MATSKGEEEEHPLTEVVAEIPQVTDHGVLQGSSNPTVGGSPRWSDLRIEEHRRRCERIQSLPDPEEAPTLQQDQSDQQGDGPSYQHRQGGRGGGGRGRQGRQGGRKDLDRSSSLRRKVLLKGRGKRCERLPLLPPSETDPPFHHSKLFLVLVVILILLALSFFWFQLGPKRK